MKKVFLFTLVALLAASPVMASDGGGDTGTLMGEKLGRGFRNAFTGILEVPFQIGKGYSNGVEKIESKFCSKTVGTILGLWRGVSHAAGRTSSGMFELVTFWTANSPSVEGVPLDAEYAWEEGTQYSIFKPNFEEGVAPVMRKIGHGMGNAFLGVLEFPGQIKKGINQDNAPKGLAKGIWYWASRTAQGAYQLGTFFLPAPAENVGPLFEEDKPFDALSADY